MSTPWVVVLGAGLFGMSLDRHEGGFFLIEEHCMKEGLENTRCWRRRSMKTVNFHFRYKKLRIRAIECPHDPDL